MLTNCCGGRDLREGSQLIAFLAGLKLLVVVIGAILIALGLNVSNKEDDYQMESNSFLSISLLIWGSFIIPYIISVILLYVGLALENGWLMLPWLIISALMEIVFVFAVLYGATRAKDLKGFIAFALMFGIDSYFELVVISYFLELVS
ncbi:uncharacterized protein [Choristoneura fumiferana]|uniref:uncharacterized protein n=1 Tax=Choristoneura fumiferana TaxID=7141 RepID=UPI003D15941A